MRVVGLMDNFVNSSGLAALANGRLGHLGVEVFGGLIVEPAAGGVSAEAVAEIVGLGAVVEFSFFFVSHATHVGLTHGDAAKNAVAAVPAPLMAERLRAAGAENAIVSSDCGV